MNIDARVLIGIVTAGLSLVFTYLPGLSQKWEVLDAMYKRLYMLGMVVLVGATVFTLSCFNLITTDLACEPKSALDLIYAVLIGIATNQTTFLLTKKEEPQERELRLAKKATG